MLSDLLHIVIALLVQSFLWLGPGYVLARAGNLLGFRDQSPARQLAIGMMLSIGVMPIGLHLLSRAVGFDLAVWIVAPLCIFFLIQFIPRIGAVPRQVWIAGAIWATLAILFTIDLKIGSHLYGPVSWYDYTKHVAITSAIERTGVPPTSPYFHPGEPVQLFYYYLWFLMTAASDRFTGGWIGAGASVIGGMIWTGTGLMGATVLLMDRLVGSPGQAHGNRVTARLSSPKSEVTQPVGMLAKVDASYRAGAGVVIAGLLLLLVTGVDIIPSLLTDMLTGTRSFSVDKWNDQTCSLLSTMLWVPHHTAAVVACFAGVMILRSCCTSRISARLMCDNLVAATPASPLAGKATQASQLQGSRIHDNSEFSIVATGASPWTERAVAMLTSGACFASAAGMSVYVTATFAVFLAVHLMIQLTQRRWMDAVFVCSVGVIALMVALPLILELHQANQSPHAMVALQVREFWPVLRVMKWLGVASPLNVQVVSILCLPLYWGMELGFFALGAIVYWKIRRRAGIPITEDESFFLLLLLVSLLVSSFFRSIVHDNDFGWRSSIPAQVLLLVWSITPARALFHRGTAPLGIAHTVAATPASPVVDQSRVSDDSEERRRGRRGYELARETHFSSGSRTLRLATFALLAIGVSSTAYDLFLLRFVNILRGPEVGANALAAQQAYQWIDKNLPSNAIVQANPDVTIEYFGGLFGHRQVVAVGEYYGTMYGVPLESYRPIHDAVSPLFNRTSTSQTTEICKRYSIDAVVVSDNDPIWKDPTSWVWRQEPLYANDRYRVMPSPAGVMVSSQMTE